MIAVDDSARPMGLILRDVSPWPPDAERWDELIGTDEQGRRWIADFGGVAMDETGRCYVWGAARMVENQEAP